MCYNKVLIEGEFMVLKKAYAKINLALEVKNKMNGYHMVNNLMIPIDLYDDIIVEENNGKYLLKY